jgi:hypothetical protein
MIPARDSLVNVMEIIKDFHDIFGGTYTFSATRHEGTTRALLRVALDGCVADLIASVAPVHRNVGSSRSRTQSPIRLTDSVQSDRTMPGSTAIHQALSR